MAHDEEEPVEATLEWPGLHAEQAVGRGVDGCQALEQPHAPRQQAGATAAPVLQASQRDATPAEPSTLSWGQACPILGQLVQVPVPERDGLRNSMQAAP